MTQALGKLLIQRRLEHRLNPLVQQPSRAGSGAGRAPRGDSPNPPPAPWPLTGVPLGAIVQRRSHHGTSRHATSAVIGWKLSKHYSPDMLSLGELLSGGGARGCIRECQRLPNVRTYALSVASTTSRNFLRDRLYEAYASQHVGQSRGDAAALVYGRDIRPALSRWPSGPILDIGCGQGELVQLLLADGFDAEGIDVSPEQVAIARATGLDRIREGDFRDILAERPRLLGAVVATDLLEHLTKSEVLDTFDRVAAALVPGGVFIARVPNAGSPFGGHIRYGDFTHESSYTARSVRQLAAAAGFGSVTVLPCPPIAHGLVSAARVALWKPISAFYRVALAVETGVLGGHIVTQNLTFIARNDRNKDLVGEC
jgi:2-polyprenyl-3-methyl-5-hydroxy-6-metoxy-1,4-benzoquinol methylase